MSEWEDEEDIPAGLAKKWEADERKGLKAGVCKSCGYAFDQDQLSCPHCETPIEIKEGVLPRLKYFFTKTSLGILLLVLIFAATFIALVQ